MTEHEVRSDRFTAVEDRFAGYEVYDRAGEKIGKVDDLFVDESDSPEYVGVKMGFLGTRSTLIPWEAVSSTDDGGRSITVATDKDTAKNGPRLRRRQRDYARLRARGPLLLRPRVRDRRARLLRLVLLRGSDRRGHRGPGDDHGRHG